MTAVIDFHEQAMDLADQAFISRRLGDPVQAHTLLHRAFELEKAAAETYRYDFSAEPTRSVLYRSAASLAIDCNELREAERLLATGLLGNPPEEIADEIRELMDQVKFTFNLKKQSLALEQNELLFSIAGNVVGHGLALSEVFLSRIKDIERLIYRTIERKLGRPFRERGPIDRSIYETYNLYIATPRAGSFSISLLLGRQLQLPGIDQSGEVILDLIECFVLLNEGNEEAIKERIPLKAYFQNFMGLAKRIAPDGDRVGTVGLVAQANGLENKVILTRKQQDIALTSSILSPNGTGRIDEVTGRLLLADGRKSEGKLKLIDNSGNEHEVIVPEGMMTDIVRPLWDDMVKVKGVRHGKRLQLQEIVAVQD